jgi:hypothetical protein
MKLIILILANDTDIYLECQKLWKTYMNTHSNIKSYFIKYKVGLNDDVILENDTIFINGNESLIPGCLVKTIKSIEFLLKTQDFDFIFRTNMSSVIDLHKFYNLVINNKNDCSAVIGYHNNIKFAWSIISDQQTDLFSKLPFKNFIPMEFPNSIEEPDFFIKQKKFKYKSLQKNLLKRDSHFGYSYHKYWADRLFDETR